MKPPPGEVIVDPACGSGFLLATHAHLTEHSKLDPDQKKHLSLDLFWLRDESLEGVLADLKARVR